MIISYNGDERPACWCKLLVKTHTVFPVRLKGIKLPSSSSFYFSVSLFITVFLCAAATVIAAVTTVSNSSSSILQDAEREEDKETVRQEEEREVGSTEIL